MALALVTLACSGVVGAGSAAGAAVGPLAVKVAGNVLVDGAGAPMRLTGVNYSGTEYACVQGWGIFDGPSDLASVQAIASWHANAVRVPLNEDCWLGINGVPAAYSGANYQAAIVNYVNLLHSQGIYAIVELHWSAPGSTKATGQNPMPDADHTPAFWTSVATAFKADPAVLLDLFNEPYPDNNADTTAAWSCWKNGGSCAGVSYQVAGMQSLVSTVRATGATNVILAGGVNYANSLTSWLAYRPADPLNQLAASAHIYGNNGCGAQNNGACLTQTIAPVAAVVPVVFGETGETYDDSECTSQNMQVILNWADAHNVSYLAWTWDTWGNCGALISDFNGTVNTTTPAGASYPSYVHGHLAAVAPTPAATGTPTTTTVTPAPTTAATGTPTPTSTLTPTPAATPTSSRPAPMRVISRGVPAFTNDSCGGSYPAKNANDSDYASYWWSCTGSPSTTSAKRLALDLSSVPVTQRGKVLVSWYNDPITSEYDHTVDQSVGYNIPQDYTIEVNATPGGTSPASNWVTKATVTANTYSSRQHVIDMTGYNWLRLRVTASDGSPGNSDVAINMDVQDASAGAQDSWIFYGDSITQDGMPHDTRVAASGATVGTFAQLVNAQSSAFPSYQNGGIQGLLSADGAAHINTWLKLFPGRYVSLGYGTNDALTSPGDASVIRPFHDNMVAMVKAVLAAGKVPVIPTIPWGSDSSLRANVPMLNNQIAQIRAAYPQAVGGADLYAYYQAHPNLISSDGIHPSWDAGYAAYRQVWADWAASTIYK